MYHGPARTILQLEEATSKDQGRVVNLGLSLRGKIFALILQAHNVSQTEGKWQ